MKSKKSARRALKTPGLYAEKFLFATEGQTVSRITNDGDGSEPTKLCSSSLIIVKEDIELCAQAVTFTAEELDDLSKRWLKLRGLWPKRLVKSKVVIW